MSKQDRINNLPDLVLGHILSFLSTIEALRTAILSTRWRKILSLLSNLSFDHHWNSDKLGSYNFMNFVDQVLLYRRGDVDKFHLHCGKYVDPYKVDGWIRYVLLNKVREIDLWIYSGSYMKFNMLPPEIFTCETLVVLRLKIFRYSKVVLHVPNKICIPNLKILHLSDFECSYDNSIQRLFSSCLVLEEFIIDGCILKSEFNICSSTLKRLTTTCCHSDYVILIDAPRLVYLKCNELPISLSLKNLNSLVEASMNFIGVVNSNSLVLCHISNLLKGISNVRSFHLSAAIDAEAFLQDSSLVCELPKVTYLNLDCCFWGGWEGVLPHLLTWFPCLEELHVKVKDEYSGVTRKEFPSFLWSQLKTFRILSFEGQKYEYQMIKYFLKNAQVLEKLTVQTEMQRSKIIENLSRLPKVSKKCIISVV